MLMDSSLFEYKKPVFTGIQKKNFSTYVGIYIIRDPIALRVAPGQPHLKIPEDLFPEVVVKGCTDHLSFLG